MQQPARTRFAVVAVAITAVLLGVAFLLLHLFSPFDGARLAPGQAVWSPDGVIVTPIQQQSSGLQQGDVVVAIAGRSMQSWAQALFEPGLARPQWHVGQTITYTVVRNGQRLDVPVTLEPYPLGTILIHEWSTVLFALVFLFVATFVFLLRPDNRAARVQLLIGASITGATTWSLGLQVGDLVNGIGFWIYIATTFGVYILFWVGLLHFVLIFPKPHPLVAKYPWTIPIVYIVPYALSCAYLASTWSEAVNLFDWMSRWSIVQYVLPTVYLVLTILIITWSYRALGTTADRQKLRWLMFAALLSGGGTIFLWYLPTFLQGQPLIGTNGYGLLALPYPLVLPIVILRYRLFDIDVLINRTLVYGTLTAILTLIYVGLILVLQSLTRALTGQAGDHPVLIVGSTLLIAALFHPLRRGIQQFIDRRFYRRKYDTAKIVAAFSSMLRDEVDLPTLSVHLVAVVQETMQPTHVSLWLCKHEQSGKPNAKESTSV
jgi:hypothetical protein